MAVGSSEGLSVGSRGDEVGKSDGEKVGLSVGSFGIRAAHSMFPKQKKPEKKGE